jgi:hypothetical protein
MPDLFSPCLGHTNSCALDLRGVYSLGLLKKWNCIFQLHRRKMKLRTLMLALALCFVGVSVSFADNPNMGTWKLNEAKSKMPAGFPKNTTVVYEAQGDNVKVTTDGTDRDGKPVHTEWTGKFDGKDYPLTGDPTADSRSYRQINDHTLALANKKDGKVTTSGRITVSADGKTRTLRLTGTDSSGNKVSGTSVYDKQ